ncbi:MAG: hypothetical protein R6U96_04070 [Promethearchaeia archaeon]
MKVDFSWIRQKFLSSKKYWKIWENITAQSIKTLEKDTELQLIAERLFEILTQILLDICTHIIAHILKAINLEEFKVDDKTASAVIQHFLWPF